jgi:hypothetical protein
LPAHPQPAPEFEPGPDRECRSRGYRWLMHLGLPVSVSLAVHIVLFGLLALKTWQVVASRGPEFTEYAAGVIEAPDENAQPALDWSQPTPLEALQTPAAVPDLSSLDFSRVAPVDHSALGAGSASDNASGSSELDSLGAGQLSLLGTGGGAGAAGSGGFGSAFGQRGELGHAGVWNVSVPANRIVYVIDFSGSIIVAVDELKRELKHSIARLRPTQLFEVVLFYGEGAGSQDVSKAEAFGSQLQPATEETRRQFFRWLDSKAPRGATDPLPALKRALALKPQAIFFFSDGFFEDSVVEELNRANQAVGAKIVCLVFDEILLQDTSRVPRETEGARRLRRVAEQNHGQFKIVTAADLP